MADLIVNHFLAQSIEFIDYLEKEKNPNMHRCF